MSLIRGLFSKSHRHSGRPQDDHSAKDTKNSQSDQHQTTVPSGFVSYVNQSFGPGHVC